MTELLISSELSLPSEAATWVISYLAKRGAGKTYNAAVQAEEMLKARIPIVVIDGMGIWWGLRVSADTKHPGLPVVVFGGDHQDLPLIPDKAADMAKAIVESNISCVLDLSGLSKRLSRRIVSDFLDELYKLNRIIRHVYIEEADLWAPQRTIGPEQDLCLSAVDNFVRRGGNHNLGVTLITQRSAVLNKDVLTQSDCLMILRTLAPQDKKAIQAWVEEQTDEDKEELKKWYDSLKSLKNGESWVWHPEPPAIHEKIMFRERETFHATREFLLTPEANKITLMSVDEFLERFTKVFKAGPSTAKMAPGTLDPGLMKELEEFRSGTKLAESVQKRLEFLAKVKLDQEKHIEDLAKDLKLFDEFRSILSQMVPIGSGPGHIVPAPAGNVDEIVQTVLKRIPQSSGAPVFTVAPLEKLQRDFQEAAKAQTIQQIKDLNPEEQKILKFIEALQRRTSLSEIMEKCLFLDPTGGGSRQRISAVLKHMQETELIRSDEGNKIYPNLRDKISKFLEPYKATPEEIDATYNHALAGITEVEAK